MEKQTQNTPDPALVAALMGPRAARRESAETVCSKLQNARVMLQEKNIRKTGRQDKFKYFELADFLPYLNPILAELKLVTVFRMDKDSATLTVINSENPEEQLDFPAPTAPVGLQKRSPMQEEGALETYARRYAYIRAFEIQESDVLDALPETAFEKPDDKNIDVEKSIGTIKSISDLNNTYRFLQSLPPETKGKWGPLLQKKSEGLGAFFDKNNMTFVCPQKSNAVAQMI
jgi:hypothetical protein